MNLLFKVLLLGAAAAAVPLQSVDSKQCIRSCVVSDVSKFRYKSGLTYEYELESESSVRMSDNESKEVQLKWSATVELSYESPCEVSVVIKDPRIEGEKSEELARQLTEWPLRAVVVDGTVAEVCADATDATVAVNIKKGILSALQSSLPSHSFLNNGIELEETDIIGICPTTYNLREESGRLFITKSKDHRHCSKRYGNSRESAISSLPLKSVIPMRTSESKCEQESEDGIFTKVTCRDVNEIAPIFGMTKSVLAQHKLKLTYKNSRAKSEIKPFKNLRETSLLYDFKNSPKNPSAVHDVELKLKDLCEIVDHGNVTLHTAQTFSDLISAMDEIESSEIGEILKQIKDKKYCSQADDLEAIYLDAVASTVNDGAITVLVENILDKKRIPQSVWRLHTIPRISSVALKAVTKLLEQEDLPSFVTLAAGSVVKTYCSTEGRQNDGSCFFDENVEQVMQVASQSLQSLCPAAADERKNEKSTLVLLKTIGNMKSMTDELQTSVKECFLSTRVPLRVRIEAAEVLRSSSLSEQDADELLWFASSENESSELRIFAYKAAVLRASEAELASFIGRIVSCDFSDQARAFILSDLTNLQFTEAPYKISIREKLAKFNISQNYPASIWNTSRSFDFSKFTRSGSFGTEFLYDLIFDEQDKSLRQLRSNITYDIFNELINIGEWGIRFENLPVLLESVLNSENGIGNTALGKLLKSLLERAGTKSPHGQIDFFLKTLGQEILFVSLASEEDYASDLLASLIAVVGDIYKDLISEEQTHSFNAIQSRSSMEISTMQGIPLLFSSDLSAVGSFNRRSNFVELGSSFEFAPVLSVITNFFVGYNFGPSLGFKLNTTLHSASDARITAKINLPDAVSLKLDFPDDDAEVFYFENYGFLMTKMPDGPEKILPYSTSQDPRIEAKNKCFRTVAGLQMCSDYDVSDWWTETDYPLVAPSIIKTTIKKENPDVKNVEISFSEKLHSEGYSMKIDIPGAENLAEFSAEVDFSIQPNEKTVTLRSQAKQETQTLELLYKNTDRPLKAHELDISYGTTAAAAEKVFAWKFSRSDGGVKMDLRTLGDLRSVLLTDVQVDIGRGDSHFVRLDNVEAVVGAGQYTAHARIGETQPSSQKRVYSALLEITKANQKLLAVNSHSKYEAYSNRRFFDTLTDVEYKGSASRVNVSLECVPERKRAAVEVTDVGSETPISFLFMYERQQAARKSMLLIQVPQHSVDFKVISRIAAEEIEFAVLSRGEELASVRGPFSWDWTQNSLRQKSKLGIRLGTPIRKSYHADTELDISENKNKVQVTINEDQQILVSYLHDVNGNIDSTLTAISKIELPDKIRTDFKLEKLPTHIESEAEMKLEVLSPQHVKYEVRVDRNSSASPPEGRISAKTYWDKSRDPEQNVQFTGNYLLEDSSHFSLRGDVSVIREIYHYALASSLEGPQSWRNFNSHFKLQVTQGPTETLSLMSAQRFLYDPDQEITIDSEVALTTAGQHEYHFKNQLQAEWQEKSAQVKSTIGSHVTSIGTFSSVFNFDSRSDPDYAVQVQGEASSAGVLEAKINYEAAAAWAPPCLKAADATVELQVSEEKLKLHMTESLADRETSISVKKNDEKIFELQLKRLADDTLTAQVQLPSNSFEVSGKFSNDEKSLIVYPDITSGDITFSAKLLNESSAIQKQLQVIFEFSHDGQQKSVVGKVTSNSSATEGHVSLDVFPDSDNVVNVSLIAVQVADGITRLEARLFSQKETDGPRIVIDLTRSSEEDAVALVYKSKSDSPPSTLISAKHIEQSPQSGVVSLLIKTEQIKFEVGGVLVKKHSLACQGHMLNATVLSPKGVAYAFEITTCAPYFIKIITGPKDAAEERYIMRAGMKSMTHAELGLVKSIRVPASQWWQKWSGMNYEQREMPVAALSTQLVAPQVLALRAQYDRETLAPAKSLILRELSSATESAFDVIRALAGKILDDISEHFPGAREELKWLRDAIDHLQWSQVAQKFKEYFTKLGCIKDGIMKFLEHMKILIDKLENFWFNTLDKMEKVLSMLEDLKKLIDDVIHWLSPENLPVLMDKMMEKFQLESLWKATDEWISLWTGRSIVSLLPGHLPDVINQTASDLSEYGQLFLEDNSIQFACSAAKRSLQKLRNHDSSHLLQYLFMASTKSSLGIFVENSTIQVNVPLSSPAASLVSAAQSAARAIGMQVPPGPPYILAVVPDMVDTVYGDIVMLPKSSSEYIFSQMKSDDDQVLVTFMDTQSSNFGVKYIYGKKSNKVVLGNGSKSVWINGKPQPENFFTTVGNMKITGKKSFVFIRSPGVTLTWDKKNLKATIRTVVIFGSFGFGWESFPRNPSKDEVEKRLSKYEIKKP